MWVWTDELLDRVATECGIEKDREPLVGYAVDETADLEAFARRVFGVDADGVAIERAS